MESSNEAKKSKERQKETEDNLWFIEKIQWDSIDSIVIVGCEYWELISVLAKKNKKISYIGYDSSKDRIRIAVEKLQKELNGEFRNIKFTNDWEQIINRNSSKSLILFPGVLHKIFSIKNSKNIAKLQEGLSGANYKYIAIRDTSITKTTESALSNYETLDKMFRATDKNFSLDEKLEEFQRSRYGGAITQLKNCLNFLLKCWRSESWDSLIKEDYFSYDIDKFISLLPEYTTKIKRRYYMQYIYNTWKKEFDIDLKENTHIVVLLERC